MGTSEGEDKPLQQRRRSDRHQVDLAAAVEFNWETAYNNTQAVRPGMPVLQLSANTGDEWKSI